MVAVLKKHVDTTVDAARLEARATQDVFSSGLTMVGVLLVFVGFV
jgi:hypothetical protein